VLPAWDRLAAGTGWTEGLVTVEEIRHAGVESLLRVLWGTTALVVASACIIAAARVLARGASRRPAVAMRVVLGAGARRIFRFTMADAGRAVLAAARWGWRWASGWGGWLARRGRGGSRGGAAVAGARSSSPSRCRWEWRCCARSLPSPSRSGASWRRGSPPGDRATAGRYEGGCGAC
jgi:hypothetical protein